MPAHEYKPSELDRVARREAVWQLRVVERKTYREIAKELGITLYTAHSDAKWIAENRIKELEKKDKELVAQQGEIYEALLNKWLPIALSSSGNRDEQLYATDRVARIMVDHAKLYGFQALPKPDGSAKELGKGIAEGVIEAMARLANKKSSVVEAEIIEEPKMIQDAK